MSNWNISRGYSGRDYIDIINVFNCSNIIVKNPGTAFHYTSFENCIKMLKKANDKDYLELFASHFNYMNDTKEFFEGLSNIIGLLENDCFNNPQIQDTVNEFIGTFKNYDKIPHKSIPPHYIISFNTCCNNLAQWKYYGKNCGVSIEYDLENCIYSNYSLDELYSEHKSFHVIYNHSDQIAELRRILQELHNLEQSQDESNKQIHARDKLLKACAAASFMKNEHYHEEQEIRLLFAPYYSDASEAGSEENLNKLMGKIEYRTRGDEYIIPYMKIRLKNKNEGAYPIKSLTVGPGQNQDLIYRSLIMFVQSNYNNGQSIIKELPDEFDCSCIDVNGIKVRKSLIPFRG